MRLATALVLLLLLTPAHAEEAPSREPGDILARLGSGEPSEIAWGAYLAGEVGVKDAIPTLVAHLRPRATRKEREWEVADRMVLDALIRLEARVPAESLIPHICGPSSVLALILLAREPGRNRGILMDLFDRWTERRSDWSPGILAVGNLLSRVEAPGFAARLMKRDPTTLTIVVHDADGLMGWGGASRFLAGRGDGRVTVPEGFPPYVLYDLVFASVGVDPMTLVADGPRPVHWTRKERTGVLFGVGGAMPRVDRGTCADEWIAAILDAKVKQVAIPETDREFIRYGDADGYAADACSARDRILERYWLTVRELLARGRLTIEEARALEFDVRVEIEDRRTDPAEPLPALPPTTVKPVRELPPGTPTDPRPPR